MSELYRKYAPRWVKVIRWRDFAERTVDSQKNLAIFFYLPVGIWWFNDLDPYLKALVIKRPATEGERLKLREQHNKNRFIVGWEIDEYATQYPPLYDTWMRRRNYPEYYGEKYNTHKKYEGIWM